MICDNCGFETHLPEKEGLVWDKTLNQYVQMSLTQYVTKEFIETRRRQIHAENALLHIITKLRTIFASSHKSKQCKNITELLLPLYDPSNGQYRIDCYKDHFDNLTVLNAEYRDLKNKMDKLVNLLVRDYNKENLSKEEVENIIYYDE